jgi:6-phosphogluconolactonase
VRVEVIAGGPSVLGARAAVWVADRLWTAVADRTEAHLAVSGGSTPVAMFTALAALPAPWEAVHVWQVDERVAPDGHPDRNANDLLEHLVQPTGIPDERVHLMPVASCEGAVDLDAAAERYAAELREACDGVLDVVHLGIGDDGHTASWPPGDPVLAVEDRDVVAIGEFNGRRRLTLTVPAVNRGRCIMVLVAGTTKTHALAGMLRGEPDLPASRIRDDAVVLADSEAAGEVA